MAMPMKLIPDLIENCFSISGEGRELDNIIYKAEFILVARALRSGNYGTKELNIARSLLTTPPNIPWAQEHWEAICDEFNDALDKLT